MAGCFGVRGELKCDPTHAARALFVQGARFRYEVAGTAGGTLELASVREHGDRLLVRVAGIADRTAAEALAGAELYAPKSAIALARGEYFDEDLAGCEIVDAAGKRYGSVDRIEHFPSSDMLVVGGRMIPMVDAIVREIDVRAKRITIDPPEGLL